MIYPTNLFNKEDTKQVKDKRRQNYRNKCKKYTLKEDRLYYQKITNDDKHLIDLLKIPYELEKNNLLENINKKMVI